jgi:hypothetical protein
VVETMGYIEISRIKKKHSLRFQPQDAMYMTAILHSGMLIGIDIPFPVVETTNYI